MQAKPRKTSDLLGCSSPVSPCSVLHAQVFFFLFDVYFFLSLKPLTIVGWPGGGTLGLSVVDEKCTMVLSGNFVGYGRAQ